MTIALWSRARADLENARLLIVDGDYMEQLSDQRLRAVLLIDLALEALQKIKQELRLEEAA